MKQICKVIDCRKVIHARKMCERHYRSWFWKIGIKNRQFVKCNEDDCDRRMYAKGKCVNHYRKLEHMKNNRKDYINKNRDLINKQTRDRRKRSPEVYLKINLRSLIKIANKLKISVHKFRYLHTLWARAVKNRDKKCMGCGTTKKLHAHHIVPKVINPDMAFDIDNGITLCEECHKKEHCAYPEKDVRRESDKRN